MIDPATNAVLQTILRREGRSLLQYVADSFPWTLDSGLETLEQLKKITQEESHDVAELGAFFVRNRVTPPFLGSYPYPFTDINFLSLEYLLPRLVKYERDSIQTLDADLTRLPDGEAKDLVAKILEGKRRRLIALEKLTLPRPEPAKA